VLCTLYQALKLFVVWVEWMFDVVSGVEAIRCRVIARARHRGARRSATFALGADGGGCATGAAATTADIETARFVCRYDLRQLNSICG
jgi:hypothetical protein